MRMPVSMRGNMPKMPKRNMPKLAAQLHGGKNAQIAKRNMPIRMKEKDALNC